MSKITLRDVLARNKREYVDQYGSLEPFWMEEGCVWIIQDYHSMVGSLLNFTRDDFDVAAQEGWKLSDLGDLFCKHNRFSLMGYDKDGDCYYKLCDSDSFEELVQSAKNALSELEKGTYRGNDGEPLDWFCVYDTELKKMAAVVPNERS